MASLEAAAIPEPPMVLYGLVTDENGHRITEGSVVFTLTSPAPGQPISLTNELSDINLQFSYVLFVPCEYLPAGGSTTAGTLQLRTATGPRATAGARRGDATLHAYTVAEQSFPISLRDRGSLFLANFSTVPYEDSDRDGLLDSWERRHFGDLRMGAGDDPDGDGRSNLTEQRAGTNPSSSSSAPQFVEVASLPDFRFQVTWSTQVGLRYRLLQSPHVVPLSAYQSVTETLPGDGNNLTVIHTVGGEAKASFYRVVVVP